MIKDEYRYEYFEDSYSPPKMPKMIIPDRVDPRPINIDLLAIPIGGILGAIIAVLAFKWLLM